MAFPDVLLTQNADADILVVDLGQAHVQVFVFTGVGNGAV